MDSAYRLTALLMGTTVLVAQPFFFSPRAVAGVPVGRLAPEVTVFIQGVNNPDNFGSGVIIGRSGNTYTVLTAGHVVEGSDRFTIQPNDGLQYTLKGIQKLPNVDLAVVQFESNSNFTIAQLGNSDQIGLTSSIYVAGFPKPGQNITVPVLSITNGEIAQVIPPNAAKDGYGFAYTNLTRAGMSGGPVFNDSGEVVAIHGRKEGEVGGGATSGAWVNLGIPINRYKSLSSGVVVASNADVQRKAQEEAQRQAQAEAQRQAQEEAQRQSQIAQQQAAADAQRKAQEESQRQAQLAQAESQRKAQEESQRRTLLAQQQATADAQRKAQEESQRQAQLAQQQAAANASRKAPATTSSGGNLLASVRPLSLAAPQMQSSGTPSTRQVCEKIRINTIVTQRCRSEAVDRLQESAAISTQTSPEAYVNNGNTRFASGSYRSAIDEYTTAIQRNPGLATAYFNRGLAYYQMGQTNGAIADFSKAADLFRSQGDTQMFQQTQEVLRSLQQAQS
ncbi:MAG: trypsin-like peptidase domain-containing protein [Thermosynechococcaceae cyanobacterium]